MSKSSSDKKLVSGVKKRWADLFDKAESMHHTLAVVVHAGDLEELVEAGEIRQLAPDTINGDLVGSLDAIEEYLASDRAREVADLLEERAQIIQVLDQQTKVHNEWVDKLNTSSSRLQELYDEVHPERGDASGPSPRQGESFPQYMTRRLAELGVPDDVKVKVESANGQSEEVASTAGTRS